MTVCDKVWRFDIGHYGGMFVDVPQEHFSQFKNMFPKAEFPRRVKEVNTSEALTVEGEEQFHKAFPKSYGKYVQVYFANASKGLATFEGLLDQCPIEQREKKWRR